MQLETDLVLAIDIGTSSMRCALFDRRGERLPGTLAQENYSLRVDQEGKAELDPRDLEKALFEILRITLAGKRRDSDLRKRTITAVGTSCFWHSLVGCDAQWKKPTPIFTWADSRCREEIAALRAAHSENVYHQQTGCMLRGSYWPGKLCWLHQTKQDRNVAHWMSPAEWLYLRLCGTTHPGLSMASGTGLMNRQTDDWDPELLQRSHLTRARLGRISEAPVQLQGAGLRRFPELGQAQWFPAVGDGAASNLGSDAVMDGVAALNMGTSGALRLISAGAPPPTPLGLFCYRVDDHRWLVGGAISNAGNLRAWALRELRLPDDPVAIDRALAARPGPTHGLTVLPFWTAERSPTWPEDIAGTISGLTQATTALDLLQALTESSYHRLAQIADLLEPIPKKKSLEIVVSGGIQKSIVALQRLTDVLGRPTRISHEAEASLRGAAVYAWQRLGHTVPAMPKGKVLRPHPKLAKAYAEARQRQVDLERRFAMGNDKT